MLKYPITYMHPETKKEVTEELYFNISKAELVLLEAKYGKTGGVQALLEEVQKEQDGERITELVEEFITLAYGERSEDGKYFYKEPDILRNFKASHAYQEFLFRVLTDEDTAATFMLGALPSEVTEDVRKQMPELFSAPPTGTPVAEPDIITPEVL